MERWIEEQTGLRLHEGEASFGWEETAELIESLAARGPLEREGPALATAWQPDGTRLVATPPSLQPIGAMETGAYLESLEEPLGLHGVVLLQAGAAALGLFEEGRLFAHKTLKKYVVRGSGRAQPSYLKARGKSRYGSRLRLGNARRLLSEVNERLTDWRDELGEPERLFYSCPVRTWADLQEARPAPPFAKARFERVALDLRVPNLAELRRVYGFLGRGLLLLEQRPDQELAR